MEEWFYALKLAISKAKMPVSYQPTGHPYCLLVVYKFDGPCFHLFVQGGKFSGLFLSHLHLESDDNIYNEAALLNYDTSKSPFILLLHACFP